MNTPTIANLRWIRSYKVKSKHQGIIDTLWCRGKRMGTVGALYIGGYHTEPKEWGWECFGTHVNVPVSYHKGGCRTEQDAKRALAGYVARHLFGDGKHIACPNCGLSSPDVRFAIVDTIQEDGAYSPIRYTVHAILSDIEVDGTVVPEGHTETYDAPNPCYDTQQPKVNKHGYYMLACRSCGHEWYDPRIHYGDKL